MMGYKAPRSMISKAGKGAGSPKAAGSGRGGYSSKTAMSAGSSPLRSNEMTAPTAFQRKDAEKAKKYAKERARNESTRGMAS